MWRKEKEKEKKKKEERRGAGEGQASISSEGERVAIGEMTAELLARSGRERQASTMGHRECSRCNVQTLCEVISCLP